MSKPFDRQAIEAFLETPPSCIFDPKNERYLRACLAEIDRLTKALEQIAPFALSPEAQANILAALDQPPAPNENLIRALARHRAAQPAPGGQEKADYIERVRESTARIADRVGAAEVGPLASPSRATTPPAEPWDIHRMCTKCVTASHCAHHQRCLAECTPADLAAPPETGERQDLGPHSDCPRCEGTGDEPNAQFRCPCRWSTSELRQKGETLQAIRHQHSSEFRVGDVFLIGSRRVRVIPDRGGAVCRDDRGRVAVRNVETNRLSYVQESSLKVHWQPLPAPPSQEPR